MEAFSALLAICAVNSPVTGEFTAQMPVTRSFDIFFDLRLNKRLSKQSWGLLFETPLGSLWRHSDGFKCVYCKITCGSSDVMQQGEPSHWHYNDVIMSAIASQINGVPIFAQLFVQVQIKANIKVPRHWPLWRESTGDRWITITKCQKRENVSIWWRHHVTIFSGTNSYPDPSSTCDRPRIWVTIKLNHHSG